MEEYLEFITLFYFAPVVIFLTLQMICEEKKNDYRTVSKGEKLLVIIVSLTPIVNIIYSALMLKELYKEN